MFYFKFISNYLKEPFIFSGTLRFNLDPFQKHTDEELWKALKLSHLESFVNSNKLKLDMFCLENGDNLRFLVFKFFK